MRGAALSVIVVDDSPPTNFSMAAGPFWGNGTGKYNDFAGRQKRIERICGRDTFVKGICNPSIKAMDLSLETARAKRSMVSAGYVEDPFAAFFGGEKKRCDPVMHRGYYARLRAVERDSPRLQKRPRCAQRFAKETTLQVRDAALRLALRADFADCAGAQRPGKYSKTRGCGSNKKRNKGCSTLGV